MGTDIQWNDGLLLDFKPLDEQHKLIFARIDEVELLASENASLESILSKLHQLRENIISHFDFEEMLMAQCDDGCQFDEHRKAHKDIQSYIDDAIASIGNADFAEIMNDFIISVFDAMVQHDGDLVGELICSGKIRILKES